MVDLERANRVGISDKEYKKRLKKKYWNKVLLLTKKVSHLIPGIEKRGFKDWHIDHIFPIFYGYKMGIPPEDIAHISNLRMLPWEENRNKGKKRITESIIKV